MKGTMTKLQAISILANVQTFMSNIIQKILESEQAIKQTQHLYRN
jgi:hypothetical protein